MARELRRMGVRLTAEGVSQYKEDLRTAGREARLMSQETRLAMLELGDSASSTDKLTTRLKGLDQEYKVQENRVKTLTNSQKSFQTSLNLVEREIEDTTKSFKDSQKETQRLENNYRKMGEALGWNAEETKKAKAEWEASKQETKQLAQNLSQLEKEQSQYSKELEGLPFKINSAKISMQEKANEMAKLREEYIRNGGALGKYADQIQDVSKRVRTFSEGMASTGDWMSTRVTAPIVAGVTGMVKAASEWESAFAGVVKTNDDVVDANGNVVYSLAQLEDELRALAREELPATHDEIAAVGEAAGQLGIQTDKVTSFTKTMIDMGESTNLSAETAASSLARLANITGMSQNDFDRLGSSIVALGNNFATTEAEITEMGLRLAGTGNQVGMTEADIMGLAAAMSSVGIQAEAGGTAMSTVLKRMQNAVADNSEELAGFAKVSRMSAKEFATAFESDPARALQAFIEGLEQSSNEGANLNGILGDLGITGVRESDTLLRLAGNSSILGNALDESATAWKENTALSEEAAVRYQTLESQLGMLRNEVYDVAIEFGGPFVKALREGLDAARPMLNTLSDMATSFSELDEEQQQTIIKFIGITAAAGPTLSILGRVGQGAANAGDGLAWLVRKVGGLQASSKLANTAIVETGTAIQGMGTTAAVAGGTSGIGGFTAALSTAMPWIAGIGLAVGAGYGVWKLWGEGAYESAQRTKTWGSDVDESTDKALTSIQNATQSALGQYGLMQQGIEVSTGAMIDDFTSIGTTIEDDINRRLEATTEYLEGLPEILRTTQEKILSEYQQNLQEVQGLVESNNERILQIQQTASNQNRDLTVDEIEFIKTLQNQSLSEYITTLNLSAQEEKNIRQALTGDVANATKEQGKQMLSALAQQEDELGHARKNAVDETKALLDELEFEYDSVVGRRMLNSTNEFYDNLVVSGQKSIDELIKMYPELVNEVDLSTGRMIDRANMTDREYQEIVARNEILLDRWAKSYKGLADEVEDSTSFIVDQTSSWGAEWNELVLASGGSTDVFREKLIEAAKETENWNDIRLQLKNADLNSNAKLIIGEAAIANGWWDGMAWDDKQAVLKDNFSETVYKAIVDEGTWDKLSWEEQIAVLNNEFSDTVIQSIIDEGKWKDLPFEQKKAILTSNSPETLRQVLKDIGIWDTLPIRIRQLLADGKQVAEAVNNAQKKINSLKGKEVTITQNFENIYTTIYRAKGSPSSINWGQSGGTILYDEGTSYHPGGHAVVNDQKGPLYKELVQLPTGEKFIPEGRDVLIPNMPIGTKVFTAAETKRKMSDYFKNIPKFAQGGTIQNPFDGYMGLVGEAGPEIFQIAQGKVSITPITQGERTQVLKAQNGNEETNRLLNELINRLSSTAEIPRLLEVLITVASDPVVQIGDREFRRLVEGIVRN